MHTWWVVIFCSPPSPTTHTSSSKISLWSYLPIAEEERARNREQGRGGRTNEKRTFQDDSCFFVSGCWKLVVFKLNLLQVFGKDSCLVEDVSVFQGTHRCLKCKCTLAACWPVVNVSLMAPLDGWLTMHLLIVRVLPQEYTESLLA